MTGENEAASPGWWERTNRRLEREQGRTMQGYVPGGSAIPYTPWGIGAARQRIERARSRSDRALSEMGDEHAAAHRWVEICGRVRHRLDDGAWRNGPWGRKGRERTLTRRQGGVHFYEINVSANQCSQLSWVCNLTMSHLSVAGPSD